MNRTRIARVVGVAGSLVGASVLLVGAASAVDLKGRIVAPETLLPQPSAGCAQEPLGCYWQEPVGLLEPAKHRVDLRREITVALVGGAPAAGEVVVRLQGGGLLPSTIVLAPNQSLRFQNDDEFPHELFADGLATFDASPISTGQARSLGAMAAAGNWAIHDRLVPHLAGHLHVVAGVAAVAHPDAQGNFSFPTAVAGTYTLKVFHGSREASSQEVQIAEAREMTLDPITLTPAPPSR